MSHVDAAVQEMFSSPKIVAIRWIFTVVFIMASLNLSLFRSASQQEQIFLRALVAEFQRTGIEEAPLCKIYKQHVSICRIEGV
jgi:origin recognition complex subunit 1